MLKKLNLNSKKIIIIVLIILLILPFRIICNGRCDLPGFIHLPFKKYKMVINNEEVYTTYYYNKKTLVVPLILGIDGEYDHTYEESYYQLKNKCNIINDSIIKVKLNTYDCFDNYYKVKNPISCSSEYTNIEKNNKKKLYKVYLYNKDNLIYSGYTLNNTNLDLSNYIEKDKEYKIIYQYKNTAYNDRISSCIVLK